MPRGFNWMDSTVVVTSKSLGSQTAYCSANGEVWIIYDATLIKRGEAGPRTTLLLPPETPAQPGTRFLVSNQVPCLGSFAEVTLERL